MFGWFVSTLSRRKEDAMVQTTLPLPPKDVVHSRKFCDNAERKFSNHKVFKPPKFGSEKFYYTEILSDWIAMKK